MDRISKGRLVSALFLLAIGSWYLAVEMVPSIKAFAYGPNTWPIQILAFGTLFFVLGILAWVPGLLIPGSIITGLGGLLLYQNSTGDWASWAYVWTLIPGFVGIGLFLFGILARKRGALIASFWNLFSSLVLFGIFGAALGGIEAAARLWPLALVMVGLFLLIRSFRSSRKV